MAYTRNRFHPTELTNTPYFRLESFDFIYSHLLRPIFTLASAYRLGKDIQSLTVIRSQEENGIIPPLQNTLWHIHNLCKIPHIIYKFDHPDAYPITPTERLDSCMVLSRILCSRPPEADASVTASTSIAK